ncbi:MAG: YunC family protein [Candidatus Bathycorpusculaceae bacterium]
MPRKKVLVVISVLSIKVEEKSCLGVKIELPNSPPLLLIIANKGFVMCGFLNIEAAERFGAPAAMVSGVKTFEDVLNAEVKAVASKAKSLGVKAGMKGIDALKLMSQ